MLLMIQLISRVEIILGNADISDSEESDNEYSKLFHTYCVE